MTLTSSLLLDTAFLEPLEASGGIVDFLTVVFFPEHRNVMMAQ